MSKRERLFSPVKPRTTLRWRLIAAALAASASWATPGWSDDLVRVYEDALKYDAKYAAAKSAYQAAQERVPQAQAGLKTTLDLNANAGGIAVDRKGASSESGGQANYTLQLAHPLWRAQNKIQVQQAETALKQFEAQLAQAQQDLAVRVAQAYFDVLLAQDSVTLSQAKKTAISEQLAQAKRNFEVGTATITDTHEAQARYDLAVSEEIANQNDLEIKQRALEQLVGRRPPTLALLRENVTLPVPNPNNMEAWVNGAVSRNPQVLAAQSQYEVARQEIERNQAAYKPTIDAVSSLNHQAFTKDTLSTGERTITGQIGVQLNVPILEGGLRKSRVREATSLAERARQDLEDARRGAALNARQQFLAVNSFAAQTKALEQALISTRSALDSTKLGQEVGVRTSIDVLNAQQQLFSARRDLFAARYNAILSHLRLRQASGYVGIEDMTSINRTLQEAPAGTSSSVTGGMGTAGAKPAAASPAATAAAAAPSTAPAAAVASQAPKAKAAQKRSATRKKKKR
jgi:outer membrane protein